MLPRRTHEPNTVYDRLYDKSIIPAEFRQDRMNGVEFHKDRTDKHQIPVRCLFIDIFYHSCTDQRMMPSTAGVCGLCVCGGGVTREKRSGMHKTLS